MNTVLNPSPYRNYVIRVFSNDFKSVSFKLFKLPDSYENTCEQATGYFYNRLDHVACGESAYPYHMHTKIEEMAPIFESELG